MAEVSGPLDAVVGAGEDLHEAVEDLDEHLHMANILPIVFGMLIHFVIPKKYFYFLIKFTSILSKLCELTN